MKPLIAKAWRSEARTMSWDLGLETLNQSVRFWTEEVRHAKWRVKVTGGGIRDLALLNAARKRLVISVMALEQKIGRLRWAKPLRRLHERRAA